MYFNILLLLNFTKETGCVFCEVRAETEEIQVVQRRELGIKDFQRLDVDAKCLPESLLILYSGSRW
jgi:hypothetical protein